MTADGTAHYERLLGELAAELHSHGSPRTQRTAFDRDLDELDNRLIALQADLLHASPVLGVSRPKLSPSPPASKPVNSRQAIDRAHHHIDAAGAALQRARRWATMPRFLPRARPKVRHLTVYALCAIVAVAVHALVILQYGVVGAAIGFAIAPLSAFAAGFLLIGHLGRPRVSNTTKRAKLNRYPKFGVLLCVAVDLVAAVMWLTA
ncbi:MAG TPA: hypothetical protein H9881_09270 [Candidatus Stackebrandtia excrementipullorum]|nr:hypothetical protein [Candidatus Stackebrandtia excrementipullorum]